jgi:hypothetical protein
VETRREELIAALCVAALSTEELARVSWSLITMWGYCGDYDGDILATVWVTTATPTPTGIKSLQLRNGECTVTHTDVLPFSTSTIANLQFFNHKQYDDIGLSLWPHGGEGHGHNVGQEAAVTPPDTETLRVGECPVNSFEMLPIYHRLAYLSSFVQPQTA